MFEAIAKCPVFKGMDSGSIEKLFKNIRYNVKKQKKGNIILFRGDTYNELIIIISGTLRGEMIDYEGKSIEIEKIEAPSPLAPALAFGKRKMPVDAVVFSDAELLYINRDDFIELMSREKRILVNFLNILSSKAQFLTQRIWFLSFKSIKEKLSYYLLELRREKGDEFILPVSQQQLSEFFAVTRPSLSRVFKELVEDGTIKLEKKVVRILNKENLISYLKE